MSLKPKPKLSFIPQTRQGRAIFKPISNITAYVFRKIFCGNLSDESDEWATCRRLGSQKAEAAFQVKDENLDLHGGNDGSIYNEILWYPYVCGHCWFLKYILLDACYKHIYNIYSPSILSVLIFSCINFCISLLITPKYPSFPL